MRSLAIISAFAISVVGGGCATPPRSELIDRNAALAERLAEVDKRAQSVMSERDQLLMRVYELESEVDSLRRRQQSYEEIVDLTPSEPEDEVASKSQSTDEDDQLRAIIKEACDLM